MIPEFDNRLDLVTRPLRWMTEGLSSVSAITRTNRQQRLPGKKAE